MLTLIAIMMVSCSSNESNKSNESNEKLGVVSVAEPSIVGDSELDSCFKVVSATPIVLTVEEAEVSSSLTSQFIFAKTSVKIKCLKEYKSEDNAFVSLLLLDENGSPLYENNSKDCGSKFYITLNEIKVGEESTFPIQVRIRENTSLSSGVVNDETIKQEILKPIKMVCLKY